MKKHNVLKIVLLSILVVALCTWIFPTASYQSELLIGERSQLGLFDFVSYVTLLFNYFGYVFFVVLATGIFYGVSYKIPAYRVILDKIVKMFKGREAIFLAITMILIATLVSITGFSFGILFIFPFIISLVLLMGYNKLVAISVTVGSTIVGIMGATLGTNITYDINGLLGLDIYSEIYTKIILLVIGLILLVYNVLLYAKKTKNGTDRVLEFVPESNKIAKEKADISIEKEDLKTVAKGQNKLTKKSTKKTSKASHAHLKKSDESKDEKKSTKETAKKGKSAKTKAYDMIEEEVIKVKPKKKILIWPFVFIFDLLFVVLLISMFQWSLFGINWFDTSLTAVKDFQIFDFPIFAKLLGTSPYAWTFQSIGNWSLAYEIPAFIVLASCFLAFIYGLKLDDFFDGVMNGIRKALKPASYMLIACIIIIIGVYHPFQLNIVKFFMDLTDGFNVIFMTIIAAISSVLNIEPLYVAQNTLPYITSVITDSELYPVLGVIFQSVYGLVMLIAPTSLLLIGTLTYLNVSYGQWLKHIWKLFLQLLVVLVIVCLIIFLI